MSFSLFTIHNIKPREEHSIDLKVDRFAKCKFEMPVTVTHYGFMAVDLFIFMDLLDQQHHVKQTI